MRLAEHSFTIALVLYSIAIWTHRLGKRQFMSWWIVTTFGVAVAIDSWATFSVCGLASEGITWNFHTITGFASLIIMAVHFAWALISFASDEESSRFSRCSPYAWGLWLVSFLSGIPWSKLAAAS